jgi:hypothetical protein
VKGSSWEFKTDFAVVSLKSLAIGTVKLWNRVEIGLVAKG